MRPGLPTRAERLAASAASPPARGQSAEPPARQQPGAAVGAPPAPPAPMPGAHQPPPPREAGNGGTPPAQEAGDVGTPRPREAGEEDTRHKTGHELRANHLSLAYDTRRVIDDLNLDVPRAAITAIVGANGCGKSTLLRGLARLLRPMAGHVLLDGESLSKSPARKLARTIGILPQNPQAPESITVVDLVRRGRHPHRSWYQQWDRADDVAVADALHMTGTVDLAGRRVDELSGGQRQRVWIAMALAQDPDILLLDAPPTFLARTNPLEGLDLLVELNRQRSGTVGRVLQDLNLAARYGDHLGAMCAG